MSYDNDNSDANDVRDESMSQTTRRGLLGALGVAGLASLGSSSASANLSGGPEADAMAEYRVPTYRVPESDLDSPGVVGREVTITSGGATYDTGDQLVDVGDRWELVSPNYGSLSTDGARFDKYSNTYSRPNGQPAFSNVNGFGDRDVGTIALETDDAKSETYTGWFQWCKNRGLPFSVAVPPRQVGTGDYCDWSEIAEMAAYGAEIANHTQGGEESGDLPDISEDGAIEKVITFREELEERGFKIQRLVTSGDADFADLEEMETFAGRLVMGNTNTVGQVKSYYGASPRSRAYCSSGGAIDPRWIVDGIDRSDIEDRIELVANSASTLTLAFHPHSFGDSGVLTGAEVRQILTKIEQLRDAGELNVVTPSVSRVMVGDSRDHAMNPDPSFEHSAVLSSNNWPATWQKSSSSVTLSSTSRTGSNSVEIPNGESIEQTFNVPERANAVVIEGYARAKSTDQTAEIATQQNYPGDWDDYTGVNGRYRTEVDDSWTKFKGLIGLHRSYNSASPEIYHNNGDTLLVDDIYVYPA